MRQILATTDLHSALVATALDLPYASPAGASSSSSTSTPASSPAFPPAPDSPRPRTPAGLNLLPATGKCIGGDRFNRYVTDLRHGLTAALDPRQISVLHLHHLAFGATPALLRAFPRHPRIAFVHGTDLLYAENHSTQLRVLREAANAADAITVPTHAMTGRLDRQAQDREDPVGRPRQAPDRSPAPHDAAPVTCASSSQAA